MRAVDEWNKAEILIVHWKPALNIVVFGPWSSARLDRYDMCSGTVNVDFFQVSTNFLMCLMNSVIDKTRIVPIVDE